MSDNHGLSIESTIFSTDLYIHDTFPDDILHYSARILDNHINEPIGRSSPLPDEQELLSMNGNGLFIYDRYMETDEQMRERLDAMLIDLINPIQYRLEPPSPPLDPPPESDFWDPIGYRLTNGLFDEIVPTHRMSKFIRKKYNMEDPVCSICQEDINSRQHCSILKCGHIYHKNCIKTWLTKTCDKPTCPCCRIDVRGYVPKESSPV